MENGHSLVDVFEETRPAKRRRPTEELQKSRASSISKANADCETDIPDTCALDELEDKTTRSFTEAVALLEASFRKSKKMFQATRKHMTKEVVADRDTCIEKIHQENNELRQKNTTLTEERARLAVEVAQSHTDLIQLKEELIQAKKDIAQVKVIHVENKKLQQKNDSLSVERANLSAQLAQYHVALAELKGAYEQVREELEDAKIRSGSENDVSNESQSKPKKGRKILVRKEDTNSTDYSIPIGLKVKSLDGEHVVFKICKNVGLSSLMRAYCMRQLIMDSSSMLFMFNGLPIGPEQTPYELQMEDGDEIAAWLCLSGGAIC